MKKKTEFIRVCSRCGKYFNTTGRYTKICPECSKVSNEYILKVWKIKQSGQKLVTIPKKSKINKDDYVKVIKV